VNDQAIGTTEIIEAIDLRSIRARKARLGAHIGKTGYATARLLLALFAAVVIGAAATKYYRIAWFAAAPMLAAYCFAVWYKRDLSSVALGGNDITGRLSAEVLALLPVPKQDKPLTPRSVWVALSPNWQSKFMTNHFLLTQDLIAEELVDTPETMPAIWQKASELSTSYNSTAIEPGYIIAALLLSSPGILEIFNRLKMRASDIDGVTAWLARGIAEAKQEKPSFGGIARDWTFGFTPLLNQFGESISLAIMKHGATYGELTESTGVAALEGALSHHAGGIALIGETGIGKSTHIYALAQLLIEGKGDLNLAYHQVVGLHADAILSAARRPGELEQIVTSLINEAAHAGHIILFLDDAALFFGGGPGSFDATNILMPVIESQVISLVMAMTPHDYQQIKIQNANFASKLTPVMLTEPGQEDTMKILERRATQLEHRHGVLITYAGLVEAYRLSGRYEQELAYPGKAIQLIEQAISGASHSIVTTHEVQAAIERSRGVKVGGAAPVEADALLHLEDNIHKRMINQVRAVSVVASALRRARAGVADPKRPIGSFLFLGPTGVGKTELAKSIAAIYFGEEANMIRLDMSEYQQPDDVQRLLSNGTGETKSLILSIRQQPFTVVLLDEIEKAHPNILNLLLQLLDEGQLTDAGGRPASFKDSIIIATSNAGATVIRDKIAAGESLESFEDELTNQLINSGQFRPELLNRFDDIVLFRPLNQPELAQVVRLMLATVNKTLSAQNISVELTDASVAKIVETGYDIRLGARPMRRTLQRAVEDGIAGRILRGEANPGDHIVLDVADLSL
jgi:ATP-dependent Clp protease ATP-binding subunit ClpC